MKKQKVCATCGGIMRLPCEMCLGTGIITKYYRNPILDNYLDELCPTCSGTGIVPCPDCEVEESLEIQTETMNLIL